MRKAFIGSLLLSTLCVGCSSPSEEALNGSSGQTTGETQNNAAPNIEHIQVDSKSLGREMAVDVYLPPGYAENQQYPVLYMLHGYGGNASTWFDWLDLDGAADRLINEGKLKPIIIVSPDIARSFGINSIPGQGVNQGDVDEGLYETYLNEELVAYMDSHYRTNASRENRYIGGFSMGGYAALYLAMAHSEDYSKAGGHSAALWDYTGTDLYTGQRDWLYPTEELRQLRDPILMASNKPLPEQELEVYLDAGDSDDLAEKDEKLYDALKAGGYKVEWHLSDGGHDINYWSSQLDNYLLFYAKAR
ncbi:alpha/beta hydrolase [Paenibacillus sp. MMS18-CY102]|uniref:alpha/beta hydrolase n=1 Tax=Paenibacillus sp. MMS18-CY102 TaxID=2682849 RepID=UPI0013655EE1|nr:alpha/beta hydrolase-fold protein [Paenibacillus sp. MMS18-CY102]MWC28106.1 esterase [Paenibacillus sp. MMS18-CY102]